MTPLDALKDLHDAARDIYADGLYPDEAWCARLNNAAAALMLSDPDGTVLDRLAQEAEVGRAVLALLSAPETP